MSTVLLSELCQELGRLSLLHCQVESLLDYGRSALQRMQESWEDLLLMVDSKLANYASVRDVCVCLHCMYVLALYMFIPGFVTKPFPLMWYKECNKTSKSLRVHVHTLYIQCLCDCLSSVVA